MRQRVFSTLLPFKITASVVHRSLTSVQGDTSPAYFVASHRMNIGKFVVRTDSHGSNLILSISSRATVYPSWSSQLGHIGNVESWGKNCTATSDQHSRVRLHLRRKQQVWRPMTISPSAGIIPEVGRYRMNWAALRHISGLDVAVDRGNDWLNLFVSLLSPQPSLQNLFLFGLVALRRPKQHEIV